MSSPAEAPVCWKNVYFLISSSLVFWPEYMTFLKLMIVCGLKTLHLSDTSYCRLCIFLLRDHSGLSSVDIFPGWAEGFVAIVDFNY